MLEWKNEVQPFSYSKFINDACENCSLIIYDNETLKKELHENS
jgi:hypothetical protein